MSLLVLDIWIAWSISVQDAIEPKSQNHKYLASLILMADPRELHSDERLTEDSDDALADLEKEFEAKKLRLIEERARKRQKKRQFQVERSPSPEGRVALLSQTSIQPLIPVAVPKPVKPVFSRIPHKIESNEFASKLYDLKTTETAYTERVFEFENVPPPKTVATGTKDDISGEVLSRRYISKEALDQLLANKKVLRVQRLLAKVVAPDFSEPDYVNWCFVGVVVHKSEPKSAVNLKKYMGLRVGNFVHSVDLMLFGDAFHRYWKLRLGDVVAILNPTVKKFSGAFNLSLLDDLAAILEIGTLKHFGHCKSTSKLGDQCKHVVDTLKNTLCSYHEESKYKQGSRMELHGSVKPKAPQNQRGERSQMYVNPATNQPAFVLYSGATQKDVVYGGGEQFDHRKYDKPVVETPAARKRKLLANKKLEEQLLHSVAPRHLLDLRRLGIVHQDHAGVQEQRAKTEAIRQHAFKSTFIHKIGFDPTVGSSDNRTKADRLQSLQELQELSKDKHVSLERSKEERAKQMQKWKQNMELLRQGNAPERGRTQQKVRKNGPIALLLDEDSDIEIAFSSEKDKSQYASVQAHDNRGAAKNTPQPNTDPVFSGNM